MPEYCPKCMMPVSDEETCSVCGTNLRGTTQQPAHVLPEGTILNGRYLLGRVIGQGGFGITYIGRDLRLDMRIAVKEYYPSGFVNRNTQATNEITAADEKQSEYIEKGKARFLQEAKVLAGFNENTGIVDVRDFFEENGTAYIVMEYLDGEDLRKRLQRSLFSADEIFKKMVPVFSILEQVHKQGIIHRDISPDNIMMLKDGSLKLMDFGAARLANYTDQKSISIVLKAGYAPEEQYRSRGRQGPWTDIYALCATIYKCITGVTPDDALDRLREDRMRWPSEMGIQISVLQENILKKGMAVYAEKRYQNVQELMADLHMTNEALIGTGDNRRGKEAVSGIDVDAKNENTILDSLVDEKTQYDLAAEKDGELNTVLDSAEEITIQEDETSKSNKSQKRKKVWIAILSIIMLAVIGAGSFYIFKNRGYKDGRQDVLINETSIWGIKTVSEASFNEQYGRYVWADEDLEEYQIFEANGKTFEISIFPVCLVGQPFGNDRIAKMVHVDRQGNEYTLIGKYSFSAITGVMKYHTVKLIQGDDQENISVVFEYEIQQAEDGMKLSSHGKSVTLIPLDNAEITEQGELVNAEYFEINGHISEGSLPYSDISKIELYYSSTGHKCEVYFTDGSLAIVDKVCLLGNRLELKWSAVQHVEENEIVNTVKNGSIVCGFVSYGADGFVLYDDNYRPYVYYGSNYNSLSEAEKVFRDMEMNEKEEIVPDQSVEALDEPLQIFGQTLAAGPFQTVAVFEDGHVEAKVTREDFGIGLVSSWKDIAAVACGEYWTFGIRQDGTVVVCGSGEPWNNDDSAARVEKWTGIVKIESSGGDNYETHGDISIHSNNHHTVGLCNDGTVVIAGNSLYGEGDVSDWSGIVDIAAGWNHTLGLRSDGTVVACGNNDFGQCDVSMWTNIVQVAAARYCSVGLKKDGTVVFAGRGDMSGGFISTRDISKWKNIISIYADVDRGWDADFVLAVCEDGSVLYSGVNRPSVINGFSDAVLCIGSSWGYTSYVDSAGAVYAYPQDNDEGNNWGGRIGTPVWTSIKMPYK